MRSRAFTDIMVLNFIGMYDYRLEKVEEDNICFTGEQGYPLYFRVEVTFVGAQYIESILHIGVEYSWRLATPNESREVIEAFSVPTDNIVVYCIEENDSGYFIPGQRKPLKFFIASYRVKIDLYYDKKNQHHLLLLDALENYK